MDFAHWTTAELNEAIRSTERALQPDFGHMLSDNARNALAGRVARLKRERTRRWVTGER